MTIKYKNLISKLVAGSLLVMALTEVAVRLSGTVDFPVYSLDSGIGYIPKPNQAGSFLNKNNWVFNDRSMGTAKNWNPSEKFNILLIGNSIVMGGNPYDQPEKLGPIIQSKLIKPANLWSIAAGGWTNLNETVYLERNPDVLKASNFFVWEYMNGGFSQLSKSRGEYVFPSERPTYATWYVFRRYVLPRFISFDMNELPPTGEAQQENIKRFESQVAELSKRSDGKTAGILFFYPGKDEYIGFKNGKDYVPDRKDLMRIATLYGLKVIDIAEDPHWNQALYREGTHPTVAGNMVLSDILAFSINEALH